MSLQPACTSSAWKIWRGSRIPDARSSYCFAKIRHWLLKSRSAPLYPTTLSGHHYSVLFFPLFFPAHTSHP
ncbi:hypothetical protein DUNSADRAFT_11619 [Dunaliella salina]|uniref:Encoded protein n=1 Tax=Dunaliella salina TaxID=3046 RepID=A0ABQ7FTP3_DUNSA|nr:hypothetical protein DUNSADRAFT_11619 [Dunaliella salina]|eukprot:KAF5825327.1 hypothetical protein DUNSADRAFT_11619 [Dunaliella salina]